MTSYPAENPEKASAAPRESCLSPLVRLLMSCLVQAACLFLFFSTKDAGKMIDRFLDNRAGELAIRVALKPGSDAVKAERFAGRIRERENGIDVHVVDAAEGRAMLALQEPWIAGLPDVDVSPLPTLLEIHHPDLLRDPAKVSRFIDYLNRQPETDFVAFNQVGQDRLVALAVRLTATARCFSGWLTVIAVLVSILAFAVGFNRVLEQDLGAAVARAIIVGAAGWVVALVVFRTWEHRLPHGLGGPVLTPLSSFILPGIGGIVVLAATALAIHTSSWLRRSWA